MGCEKLLLVDPYQVWLWYFADSPQQSTRITGEELDYIESTTEVSKDRPKLSETPFGAIFTNKGFLALLAAGTTGTIQSYVIADYMPKYLKVQSVLLLIPLNL